MSNHCDNIRYRLTGFQNDLMAAHTRIIPARQDVQHFERQISDLENQIQNAELQVVVGRFAPRVLGPGGFAVSALNSIETDNRIGRLNDNLNRTEADLRGAKRQFETTKDGIGAYESHISSTEAEFSRSGCD